MNKDVRFISGNQFSGYFRAVFNPPKFDNSFTKDDFEQEFFEIKGIIESYLKRYGIRYDAGHMDDSDFATNDCHDWSRWIEIQVHSTKIFRAANLIRTLQDYLIEFREEYIIWLTHEFLDRDDDTDVDDLPFFDCLISQKEIMVSKVDKKEYLKFVTNFQNKCV